MAGKKHQRNTLGTWPSVVLSTKQPSAIWSTLKKVVVSNANAKRCESVTTLPLRGQALTALRLRKLATSAVAVGKAGHKERE